MPVPFAFCFGECLVNQFVEAAAVHDLYKRGAAGFAGNNPDSWRVLDADALAEIIVSLDLCGQLALRIYDKWKGKTMLLCEFLGEVSQIVLRGDAGLIGKDGIAEVIAELL